MDWQTLSWQPADGPVLSGAGPLANDAPLFQSALEEAASAAVLGPVTIAAATAARPDDVSGLAADFTPLASFELLGSPRRGLWSALDPSAGHELGGVQLTAAGLGATLVEALDQALGDMLGEGANLGAPDTVPPFPAGEVGLLRLEFRDVSGGTLALVVAFDMAAAGELAAHVVALQVLRDQPAGTAGAAESGPAGAPALPAAPAPVASAPTPVRAPAPFAAPATNPPAAPEPSVSIHPAAFEEFAARPAPGVPGGHNIDMLLGVNLEVSVEIGRTHMPIRDILALAPGSIVELDKLAGEPVDVLVNGRCIASGEVVVVDENFGVRITSIVSRQRRVASAGAA